MGDEVVVAHVTSSVLSMTIACSNLLDKVGVIGNAVLRGHESRIGPNGAEGAVSCMLKMHNQSPPAL
jgi:hypothetical protein